MRILIVEDETAAYENLVDILAEIDLGVQITGYTESISQTVHWLQNNPSPDLILMDIHLSDGSAFSIFKAIQVETPIIFTTAYDEYAIDAFKVNSIDYLLKPIKVEELRNALEKFNRLKQPDILQYLSQLNGLGATGKFRDKLLIPYKDQLLPVDLTNVSCFYSTEKNTRIYLRDGKCYPYCKTLDQIVATLDPVNFIRANKQFIIARNSVKNITIWFDSRLLITLEIDVPERIYVSKNKAAEFKAWITSEM
ncbi:MAG TPA: LytTR family DNA-binding domain-containing protein [Bacteroidales bacterium]|jgi:DNA-binding LytR/AlgR family response regulator|nr:LytTR family DNA-binding domain-containing protein [Bacteroidales bacterium]